MKSHCNTSADNGFSDEDLPVFESLDSAGHNSQYGIIPDLAESQPSNARPSKKSEEPNTDFVSLSQEIWEAPRAFESSTFIDNLIAFLAPFLIFVMVISVVFYLLNIRYVYTENMHQNISFAGFFFVLGTVALNRLIARDGSDESLLYIVFFAGTAFLYTMALQAYGAGSLAGSFMKGPGEPLFNGCLVAFLWWMTNRLTHECCVDTFTEAGETGLLRGTASKLLRAIERREASAESGKSVELFSPVDAYEPVDPTAWNRPKVGQVRSAPSFLTRPRSRHPGISVLFFSLPAMVVFALGERVIQHGGQSMLNEGKVYVVCFTASALMLLMLTSLFQLRAYFRERRVRLPRGLVVFWLTLGMFLVLTVLFGAAALPKPPLPPMAYVASHEYDPWRRDSSFRLTQVVTSPAMHLQQSRVIEFLGYSVLITLGIFILYAALRGIGALAAGIARRRDRYPQWVIRFFDAIDRLLIALAGVPRLGLRRRSSIRISRDLSQSITFRNPLGDPQRSQTMGLAEHVAYAYAALCAIAADLGVPKRPDQTPYEFIHDFPKQLAFLSEEAVELTHLFVLTNYADAQLDERVFDRLRKFWFSFERFRRQIVV